ncbi:MAG: PEP-CTERM sorting domain-containing protein [Pirellulales bacterium]
MRRIKFLRLVVALACAFGAGNTWAQGFDLKIGTFKVIPRLSVLHRTGGFAGVSERLGLSGQFDVVQSPLAIYPPIVAFDNAEVWGALISDLPHPAIVEDVDELLNLEGLHGRQLPVMAPFDAYQFRGKLADDSSIELTAAKIGPWMYVRGFTTPPPGSADFFEYQLRMVGRSRPFADMNDDGKVDAADYTLLVDSEGQGAGALDAATAGATVADWREQFGESVPDFDQIDSLLAGSGAGVALTGAAAVPEPATIAIALLGMLALVGLWRRGR